MFISYKLQALTLLFLTNLTFADTLSNWVKHQSYVSKQSINAAISQPTPGAVAASPSRENPNYYFHWIRDAAITMKEVVFLYANATEESERTHWKNKLIQYIEFSRKNQMTPNQSGPVPGTGLGEPFFQINGDAVTQAWGRPQNDGPALRALTLLTLTKILLKQNQIQFIRSHLFNPNGTAQTVIKEDLDYIAQYWQMPCFDLWEEILGDHFYTRYMQWRALSEGAFLARTLNDQTSATKYQNQAALIQQSLENFWDSQRSIFVSTLNRKGGNDYKNSNIDSSVIIAVVQGGLLSGPFSISDARIESTFNVMKETFFKLYKINQTKFDVDGLNMAPGIGRYPEDRYNGYRTDGSGNPWFIATHAFAEYLYLLSNTPSHERSKFRYIAEGDTFLRRSKFHTDLIGHQSEQFNRDNGFMQGAHDLAWSYASFLSAIRARK